MRCISYNDIYIQPLWDFSVIALVIDFEHNTKSKKLQTISKPALNCFHLSTFAQIIKTNICTPAGDMVFG
jgi:hypothetical protein